MSCRSSKTATAGESMVVDLNPVSAVETKIVAHHIGGEPCSPANGRYFDVVSPSTGDVIAKVASGDRVDADAAIAAAQNAYPDWDSCGRSERAALLHRVADIIESRKDEFAGEESRDTGKPLALAREIDVPRVIANFRFFADYLPTYQDPVVYDGDDGCNYTIQRSIGPVALITPWNLPLLLLSWKTAPALAMGNTVVAKPSERAPLTAALLAEVFAEAGAPAGIFNVIHGFGHEAGQPLCEHKDIGAISFTGGTVTGKTIGMTAGGLFKKHSLEMSGKNPALVFEDADLELAVDGTVRSGFLNQGQVCLCTSRLLVHESIYQEFVDRFVEATNVLKIGDPAAPDTQIGALIDKQHLEKVRGCIGRAVSQGGVITTGGDALELEAPFDRGAFLRPTVITGLDEHSDLYSEEVFGPVVSVHSFASEDDAVKLANIGRYGLCASIWTRDKDRGRRVSDQIRTGMFWINGWMVRDLRVPFGGVKDSGNGCEGGRESFDFFTEPCNVCMCRKKPHSQRSGSSAEVASGFFRGLPNR
ncbi:MAG: aldehyde dehydrogenase [Gemmatimonadales bacterium]